MPTTADRLLTGADVVEATARALCGCRAFRFGSGNMISAIFPDGSVWAADGREQWTQASVLVEPDEERRAAALEAMSVFLDWQRIERA